MGFCIRILVLLINNPIDILFDVFLMKGRGKIEVFEVLLNFRNLCRKHVLPINPRLSLEGDQLLALDQTKDGEIRIRISREDVCSF